MYYGITTLSTNWDEEEETGFVCKIIRKILFFIPDANPDIESLYPKVKIWLLEVDENGIPQREIALNKDKEVLFCTPNKRNYGYWTDSPIAFEKKDLKIVEKNYFDSLWHEV